MPWLRGWRDNLGVLLAETTWVEDAVAYEASLEPGTYQLRFHLTNPLDAYDLLSLTQALYAFADIRAKVAQIFQIGVSWQIIITYRKPPDIIDFVVDYVGYGNIVGVGFYAVSAALTSWAKVAIGAGILGGIVLLAKRRK